ncbi:hypothetical protein [Pseudanabaena sp. BC1403]|uniref:hypothetical protein n=1 Tax=Pseudanabaena sp. BC1403 TaxID=2043171 RepID=UPI000CD98F81|nr:hypothetical protein [Pseudanabaena sp. BC1403]
MINLLDPKAFYYCWGGIASLYFLRWFWLKLYPPQIPDKWKNNASIEKADRAIKKVEEFIESIARGDPEVSLTLAEEELNAICKAKKSIYHFSITENKLFTHELKDFYVLSIKGYIFATWEISFGLRYDSYFERDIIIENDTLLGVKGGFFDIADDDTYQDERLIISQGKLAQAILKDIVIKEPRERGIPSDYIKQIEIKDGNLIFFA